MSKKWFIIEGNIGSGKTTLVRKLKDREDTEVIEEPVDLWLSIRDDDGKHSLLDLFYSDSKRYSYLFQTMVFKTRLMSLDHEQEKSIRFSERSIWTDKYIFGENCIENNMMNAIEAKSYYKWFNWLEKHFEPNPAGIIYIQCSPEKCMERIKKRAREGEDLISYDYLKQLHNKHEKWLTTWTKTPVLIIDNEKDDNWDCIMKQIEEFINF